MVRETALHCLRPGAKSGAMGAATRGFSLVELIVVITITGIIASVIGVFITGPVQGFFDQARRAALVDAGQLALVRMGRDLRASLPNSVRVNGAALELLLTLDGDRYRTEPATDASPASAADLLQFDAPDASFNTFRQLGAGQVVPAGARLAVYPLGPTTGASPYTTNVLTPATTTVILGGTSVLDGTTEHRVVLSAAHRFPFESPNHRVFLVSGPVSYHCTGGDLLRYEGYAVAAGQPVPPGAPAGATATVVVDRIVQGCTFTYDAGTAQRNAVAALTLELVDPAQPLEVIRLVRQVHMSNVP
jgi:MSHA biogenesis protein MshO